MATPNNNPPLINADTDSNSAAYSGYTEQTVGKTAEEIISEMEQEIESSPYNEVTSILSYPHTVMELSSPKNVNIEFVYNKFEADELYAEKYYADKNNQTIEETKQPRYNRISWTPKPDTFSIENIDLPRLEQFIRNNDLDVDLVNKYIFVRHGKSSYLGDYSKIEDALDESEMTYSFTVSEMDEFAVMNRSNYLCPFDSSEDVDYVIAKALKNIAAESSNIDLKNYLFESVMNYDENDIITYDNFDFSNTFELDRAAKSRFDYIGYIMMKEKINSDGTIKRDYNPIIILGAGKNHYIDPEVSYGSTYKYRIASLGRISFSSVDVNGNNIIVNIFVKSAFSIVPATRCVSALTVKFPVDLRFVYNKYKKSVFVQWHSPIDKKKIIAGYILFTRKDLKFPYAIYRVHDNTPVGYNRSEISGITMAFSTSPESQDSLVATKNSQTWSLYSDWIPINHGEKFYVALMSYGVHNELSLYSEQYMISYDIYNGLDVRRISESDAPVQFPNYFIDKNFQGYDTIYDQVRKDIVVKNYKTMLTAFKPIAQFTKSGAVMKDVFCVTKATNFKDMAGSSNATNRNYYKFVITDMDIKETKFLMTAINKDSE